jgi:hypothetical protein
MTFPTFKCSLCRYAAELPIFLAHGTADMVLRYEYGTMVGLHTLNKVDP